MISSLLRCFLFESLFLLFLGRTKEAAAAKVEGKIEAIEEEAATTAAEAEILELQQAAAQEAVVVQEVGASVEVVKGDAEAKFTELDTDKSGHLDQDELLSLAEWVWCSFHPDEIITAEIKQAEADKIMKKCDTSGDGQVDKAEFLVYYEHHSVAVHNFKKVVFFSFFSFSCD